MNLPPRSRVPWLRVAAWAAVLGFAVLVGRHWHPLYGFTAFIQIDESSEPIMIPAFRDPTIYVYPETGGYDGQYYAQIAYDPLLRTAELARATDNLSYRARRILPSLTARILAFGNEAAIVHVYATLNIAVWLMFAAFLWRLLRVDSFRAWLGWAGILFSAGSLASVRLALTDLPMAALMAVGIAAAVKGRSAAATGWIGAAALTRETAVLALLAAVQRPWISRRNLGLCVMALLPLALWLAYIRIHLGPVDAGLRNFAAPGIGLIEKWREVFTRLSTTGDPVLEWTTLLATLGLTAQAAFVLLRIRCWADAWWRLGAAYVLLMLTLGTAVWEDFPGAAMRVLLPLTLAFNVLAVRVRAPIIWFLVGNLGVGAGIVALRDVPFSRELDYGSEHGLVYQVQVDRGFAGVERDGRKSWTWSSGESRLRIFLHGKESATAKVSMQIRSLDTRIVEVSHQGTEIWAGAISPQYQDVKFSLKLEPGESFLEFRTDRPGLPENADGSGRHLAFAIYNLEVDLADP